MCDTARSHTCLPRAINLHNEDTTIQHEENTRRTSTHKRIPSLPSRPAAHRHQKSPVVSPHHHQPPSYTSNQDNDTISVPSHPTQTHHRQPSIALQLLASWRTAFVQGSVLQLIAIVRRSFEQSPSRRSPPCHLVDGLLALNLGLLHARQQPKLDHILPLLPQLVLGSA